MSGVVGGQMFTIEQIELIRRLRNSGITKEQVVQAFESLERINQELGPLYNVPVSQNALAGKPTTSQSVTLDAQQVYIGKKYFGQVYKCCDKQSFGQGHSNTPVSNQQNQSWNQRVSTKNVGMAPSQQRMHPAASGHFSQNSQAQSTPSKQNVFPVAITANPHGFNSQYQENHKRKRIENVETIDLDDIDSNDESSNTSSVAAVDDVLTELHELLRKGNDNVVEEIRKYVGQHDIKQGQIASFTGQTLALVDKFLQGDYRELHQHVMTSLFTWYIKHKNAVVQKMPFVHKMKNDEGQDIIIHQQKRERFTFREKHLEVLESCFKENSYPSQDQRQTIAQMCNLAVTNMGNRILQEREKVTPHMVLNWFANRRKEVKRISREEGIPEAEVVLPSKIVRTVFDDSQLSYLDSTTQSISESSTVVKQEPD